MVAITKRINHRSFRITHVPAKQRVDISEGDGKVRGFVSYGENFEERLNRYLQKIAYAGSNNRKPTTAK